MLALIVGYFNSSPKASPSNESALFREQTRGQPSKSAQDIIKTSPQLQNEVISPDSQAQLEAAGFKVKVNPNVAAQSVSVSVEGFTEKIDSSSFYSPAEGRAWARSVIKYVNSED